MGFENYISEIEAASVAGVSITTLRRFAEAGYFRIETEQDGLQLYARGDLERTFGVKANPPPGVPPKSTSTKPAPSNTEPLSTMNGQALSDSDAGASKMASNGAGPNGKSIAAQVANDINPVDSEREIVSEKQPLTGLTSENGATTKIPPISNTDEVVANGNAPAQGRVTNASADISQPRQHHALEQADRELNKLELISEMQDKLLAQKDEQLQSLREERDWLRTRIEKLEEKGSRDQLLLLAETQTIKTLITLNEQHRSPVRRALEWFGFIEPPMTVGPARSAAIDVTHEAPPKDAGQSPDGSRVKEAA